MKINETIVQSPLEDEFAFILEQLAIKSQDHITENFGESSDGDGMNEEDQRKIKAVVRNTFDFLLKGNVFIYVGERKITVSSTRKLEDFYLWLVDIKERLDVEAISQLFNILAPHILFGMVNGAIISGMPLSKAADWLKSLTVLIASGEGGSIDPFGLLIGIYEDKQKAKDNDGLRGLSDAANQAADEYVNEAVGPTLAILRQYLTNHAINKIRDAGTDPEATETPPTITHEVSQELVRRFIQLAKRNPKKAVMTLKKMYNAAPEEYKEAFRESVKVGIKRSLLKRAKSFIFNIGKTLLGGR